jgi:hypothetical protein
MGLKVYNGSSWSSQASAFNIYGVNGAFWTPVTRAYVYDGSPLQWKQFYPEAPANTASPTITFSSGSAYPAGANQSLSASTGTWTNNPTSYTYQWEYKTIISGSFSSIAGATSSSYSIPASMAGTAIRVAVTATNARGATTAYSSDTGYLSPGPVTGLSASKTGYGTVYASWNASYGADLYQIQYSMGSGYINTTTTSTNWTLTNISPGPTVSIYVAGGATKNGWGGIGLAGAGQQVFVSGLP